MSGWREDYVLVDGLQTHYLEAGEGPSVVLLHAGEFGAAAEFSWEWTIPALAERYRVVAPDWLGFGYTDKVHDFVSGTQRRLAHMTRFLNQMDIGPAAFVGNSMGGLLLGKALASNEWGWPSRAAVIISGGGVAPENEHRRTLLDYDCTRESMKKVLQVLFHDPALAEDESYLERRYEMSIVPGAWECAAAARLRSPVAPTRSEFGVPDPTPWESIECPTLFVAGAEDVLKEKGYADELARRVQDGRVIVYEDCGHAPNIEIPDRFNRDLLEFLAETFPSP